MKLEYLTKCGICGKEFRNYAGLSKHISQAHTGVSNQEYYDKYMKEPGEGVCGHCGKPTGFSGRLNRGYYEHCSNKCIAADRTVDEKRRATKLALYGDATFNNHAKTSQTKLERYGDANYANGDQIRATKLERYGEAGFNNVAKREATKLERFGDANFVNPAKGMATKAERYGDAHYNNPDKAAETKLERYGDIGYLNHDKASRTINAATIAKYNAALKGQCEILEYSNRTFRCRCNTCNSEFTIPITTGFYRLYRFGINWCTVCQPAETSRSKQEDLLYEFVQGLLPGVEVRHSDRDTIPGIEMDIYVPSMKVAVEFDGLFWHDERHKTRIYHVNKTDRCESNGIHLLHVFEDEWVFQKDIVKSRIAGIMGKNRTIYARKCSVIDVSADVAGKFLDDNHIQGKCVSRWRNGLVFDGELVAVMTLGQNRFTSGIELLRYCSKCGTNVVGGAGRLFRRFTEENADVSEVISYADRRWSGGGAFYSKIGFELAGKTYPSYYYVIGNHRHNRMEFMKQNLVAAGYPADKSEHDIMLSRGIYRIYDCGNWKYVWRRK